MGSSGSYVHMELKTTWAVVGLEGLLWRDVLEGVDRLPP